MVGQKQVSQEARSLVQRGFMLRKGIMGLNKGPEDTEWAIQGLAKVRSLFEEAGEKAAKVGDIGAGRWALRGYEGTGQLMVLLRTQYLVSN